MYICTFIDDTDSDQQATDIRETMDHIRALPDLAGLAQIRARMQSAGNKPTFKPERRDRRFGIFPQKRVCIPM